MQSKRLAKASYLYYIKNSYCMYVCMERDEEVSQTLLDK